MTFSTKALLTLTSVIVVTGLVYRHGSKRQQEEARQRRMERRRKRAAQDENKTAVAVT